MLHERTNSCVRIPPTRLMFVAGGSAMAGTRTGPSRPRCAFSSNGGTLMALMALNLHAVLLQIADSGKKEEISNQTFFGVLYLMALSVQILL